MTIDIKESGGAFPRGKAFSVATDICLFLAASGLMAFGGSRLIRPPVRSTGKNGKTVLMEESGFSYDSKQDIFFSIKKPWQRKFGYCHLYDETAPLMNCIFDSEPVRFEYEGKKWLIEFWKGQYGMTTGCEIGVYTKDAGSHSLVYRAAREEDNLQMSASLVRDEEVLFTREDRHWWLTGFVLGEYSEPEELTMHVRVTLKTEAMCRIFVGELENMGYRNHRVLSDNKTVCFVFDQPRASQPLAHSGPVRAWVMKANRAYCDLYRASGIDLGKYLQDCDVFPVSLLPYGSPYGGFPYGGMNGLADLLN